MTVTGSNVARELRLYDRPDPSITGKCRDLKGRRFPYLNNLNHLNTAEAAGPVPRYLP